MTKTATPTTLTCTQTQHPTHTTFLRHEAVLDVPDPWTARRTLARLEQLWDVRRPRSDLHRLLVRPGVVQDVSPETVLLAQRAAELAGRRGGDQHAVHVHAARGQVGMTPYGGSLAGSLVVATAVDLLVDGRAGSDSAVRIAGTAYAAQGRTEVVRVPGGSWEVRLEAEALATAAHVAAAAGLVAVAVLAPSAWQAQGLADHVLAQPHRAAELLQGCCALLVHSGGALEVGGRQRFSRVVYATARQRA